MKRSHDDLEMFARPPISAREQLLIDAYCRETTPLDELPYTPALDRIVKLCTSGEPTRHDYRMVLTMLQLLKKRGLLPHNGSQYKTKSEKVEY